MWITKPSESVIIIVMKILILIRTQLGDFPPLVESCFSEVFLKFLFPVWEACSQYTRPHNGRIQTPEAVLSICVQSKKFL